jgi:hypothetical protein
MAVAAGARILAADIQALQVPYARKTANQSVTSSTVFVNDTQLVVAVSASRSYAFSLNLIYQGATAGSGDIKLAWSVPAGSVVNAVVGGVNTGLAAVWGYMNTAAVNPSAFGTNGGVGALGLIVNGTITVSTTPGSLQLQWAQNTSSGTATIVLVGSNLTIRDIT